MENASLNKCKHACACLKKDLEQFDKKKRDFKILVSIYKANSSKADASPQCLEGNEALQKMNVFLDKHLEESESLLAMHVLMQPEEAKDLLDRLDEIIPQGKSLLEGIKRMSEKWKISRWAFLAPFWGTCVSVTHG